MGLLNHRNRNESDKIIMRTLVGFFLKILMEEEKFESFSSNVARRAWQEQPETVVPKENQESLKGTKSGRYTLH